MRGCPEVEFVRIQRPVVGFPGGSVVENLPAMQETRVRSLGQEHPLEKGMATYSSILDWRIPWTEEPGKVRFMNTHNNNATV